MKREKIITVAILGILTLSQLAVMAQAGPPGPGGEGAPIDGGAIALLIGAGLYGYRQLKTHNTTKESE